MSGSPVQRLSPVLERYAKRRPLWSFLALAGIAMALYLAFFAVDPTQFNPASFNSDVWDFSSFTDAQKFESSMKRLSGFVAAFGNPNTEAETISRAWDLTWQTLSAALLGTALAMIFGYLLALGAAKSVSVGEERPSKWLGWFPFRSPGALVCSGCRLILDVLRAVPDFAWAVLLVPLLGIGPMTGMLALAISVTGILGKIYSEIWDSIDPRRYENVRAVGAGRLRTFTYGIRPLASRSTLSYTLMRAECAIRNAAVIGAVGGGGVGAEIKLRLGYGQYDRVATMVIFTIGLTFAADLAANFIRRQLRVDPNHPRAARNQSLTAQLSRKWIGAGFAFSLVVWSGWYQAQPHQIGTNEPQLPRLVGLFKPEGWARMNFFKELMQPELFWSQEQETDFLRTNFIANKRLGFAKQPTVGEFAAHGGGKTLALGPPSSDSSHNGPRQLIERATGKSLEEVFPKILVFEDDWQVIAAVASGRADFGAILWDNYGASRKVNAEARRNITIACSTEFYRGTKLVKGEWQTALRTAPVPVAMALVGTLIGVLAAMCLAFLHSVAFQLEPHQFTGESPSILARVARGLALVISRVVALVSRGIPEVMWAMFFVAFFGMGVVAGAAAIALHTMGLLARVFSETVDNIPYRRFEQSFAGSRLATYSYAAVPLSWHDWMTYSFFQFESNVRAGVVLGIIGSAGLGFEFSRKFEHFHYPQAATDLLVIILLTIAIDRASRLLKLSRVTT